MAIAQEKYINITSSVTGQPAVTRRDLTPLTLTQNQLLPTGSFLDFTTLADVAEYFGEQSSEYAFAAKCFNWRSKTNGRVPKITFSKYSLSATPAELISTAVIPTIAEFNAITDGAFGLSINGSNTRMENLDFSGATSIGGEDNTAVTFIIESAIRLVNPDLPEFANATLDYENGRMNLRSGVQGAGTIGYLTRPTAGTDISGMLGLSEASGAILSNGADAASITQSLAQLTDVSNSFGSFRFNEELNIQQILEAATWNSSLNVRYLYSIPVVASDVANYTEQLGALEGYVLTLSNGDDYAEYMPMVIGGAVNYSQPNSAVNFMWQLFPNDTPTVTSTTDSNTYDALGINYLGQIQQAGALVSMYQRGVMRGAQFKDIGIYWNEMWFKDACTTAFYNLFFNINSLPANSTGASKFRTILQPIIEDAKEAGVISPDKILTALQRAVIADLTGDENAWIDVQTSGYTVTVTINQRTGSSGAIEYYIEYLLIYSKGDSIKTIEGRHILI